MTGLFLDTPKPSQSWDPNQAASSELLCCPTTSHTATVAGPHPRQHREERLGRRSGSRVGYWSWS